MKKRKIISISGELASGKGEVSKILKKELNYEIFSSGEYFRNLAKQNKMDVTTFGKYVETHPEIDLEIENRASKYAKDHDEFIIDARLGWYVVPESYKVYLTVHIDEAAKRAFNDSKRKDTENFITEEEHKKDIKNRFELENKRYKQLYGIDKSNHNNYDLVIDTTTKNPQEVADIIIKEYKKWLKN